MIKKRDEVRDIRVFAGGLGVILFVLGALNLWKGSGKWPWLFAFAVSLPAVGLPFPKVFKPVYVVWMKIAGFIGKVNTYLILTLTYYLVLTPIRVLMRLFGRDILDMKWEKDSDSCWLDREPERDLTRYDKQY
ncbi:MAG: SxtJ family membrane protein [Nitrospinota bacterium]